LSGHVSVQSLLEQVVVERQPFVVMLVNRFRDHHERAVVPIEQFGIGRNGRPAANRTCPEPPGFAAPLAF
jgi:hypothetical protein